jgi:hypothetical protein
MVSGVGTPIESKWKQLTPTKLRAAIARTVAVLPTPDAPVTTRIFGGMNERSVKREADTAA